MAIPSANNLVFYPSLLDEIAWAANFNQIVTWLTTDADVSFGRIDCNDLHAVSVTVTGAISFQDVEILGTLNVAQTTILNGAVTIDSTLDVSDDITTTADVNGVNGNFSDTVTAPNVNGTDITATGFFIGDGSQLTNIFGLNYNFFVNGGCRVGYPYYIGRIFTGFQDDSSWEICSRWIVNQFDGNHIASQQLNSLSQSGYVINFNSLNTTLGATLGFKTYLLSSNTVALLNRDFNISFSAWSDFNQTIPAQIIIRQLNTKDIYFDPPFTGAIVYTSSSQNLNLDGTRNIFSNINLGSDISDYQNGWEIIFSFTIPINSDNEQLNVSEFQLNFSEFSDDYFPTTMNQDLAVCNYLEGSQVAEGIQLLDRRGGADAETYSILTSLSNEKCRLHVHCITGGNTSYESTSYMINGDFFSGELNQYANNQDANHFNFVYDQTINGWQYFTLTTTTTYDSLRVFKQKVIDTT